MKNWLFLPFVGGFSGCAAERKRKMSEQRILQCILLSCVVVPRNSREAADKENIFAPFSSPSPSPALGAINDDDDDFISHSRDVIVRDFPFSLQHRSKFVISHISDVESSM
jgi:hypothetical protein